MLGKLSRNMFMLEVMMNESRYIYFLTNKLFNVRHPITMVQALGHIPTDDDYWSYHQTITSAQAKELAQQLGLTSQQ